MTRLRRAEWRPPLIAAAYRLDCFRDLWLLGRYDRVRLARRTFGTQVLEPSLQAVERVTSGWSYALHPRSVAAEVLLLHGSPHFEGLSVNPVGGVAGLASALYCLGAREVARKVDRQAGSFVGLFQETEQLLPRSVGCIQHDGSPENPPRYVWASIGISHDPHERLPVPNEC